MPLKDYINFEKSFFKKGEFNKKLYESYWDDDDQNDNDEDEYWWDDDFVKKEKPSAMLSSVNYGELLGKGLYDYTDIVEKCIIYFEKQISTGNYGDKIIPPLEEIKDYIISIIGLDYKEYINEDNLDRLSKFIYNEIDKYIFD